MRAPSLSLLLFALPALSARYHIRSSVVPADCIVSTGREEPGDPVITARVGILDCPPNTVVNVNVHAPLSRNYTYGPVSGKSGLFIGKSEDGEHLEWVKAPYEWEFSHSDFPKYHFVQVPEHDEFWADAGSDKGVKIVSPSLREDAHWYFEELHA